MAYFTEREIDELRQAFTVFDKDGSGSVTQEEFKTVLTSMGIQLSDNDLNEVISRADVNGDGTISFNEFINLVAEKFREPQNELQLIEVFRVVDRDNDWRLSKAELKQVIQAYNMSMDDNELDLLFEQADELHQGYITYEEYVRIMKCL